MVWKELKELWQARGSGRSRWLSYVSVLLVFGVLLPLQERDFWTQGPMGGVFIMLLPVILAGGVVADSFAGERERHTLETLLATRLSDRDIYLGKVAACVIYCVGLAWTSGLLSLVSLNVTRGAGPIYLFSPVDLAFAVAGGILLSLMVAGIGVFVSLRAPTVRAAAQIFSLATVVGFVGLPFLLRTLPDSARVWVVGIFESVDPLVLGLVALAVAVCMDAILLALGINRFRRKRLILE